MRWTPGGESQDIEDRRDQGGGDSGGGFGFGPFGGMHLGIGGTLVLVVLSLVFKTNLFQVFSGAPQSSPTAQRVADPSRTAAEKPLVQFVSFVLDDAQHTWEQLLPQQANTPYRHAHLVLFRDYTTSGCGAAESATGPFYCPQDEKVYIDLGFYDELKTRFGASGDFAQAYVLAHELGHHVQKLLGTEAKMMQTVQAHPSEKNPLSVKLELQADCYAGVWGHTTEQRNLIDQADIQSGLGAAAAVGDDRLQKMATGHVSPESFTHGTSAQRTHWFQTGLQSGQISACNTFGN
jgi:hypothetical protein